MLNFSNHSVKVWSKEQIDAAMLFDDGVQPMDAKIPTNVDPLAEPSDMATIADAIINGMDFTKHNTAMIGTELSLAIALLDRLTKVGVKCFVAATNYTMIDRINPDRSCTMVSNSWFVKFRRIN